MIPLYNCSIYMLIVIKVGEWKSREARTILFDCIIIKLDTFTCICSNVKDCVIAVHGSFIMISCTSRKTIATSHSSAWCYFCTVQNGACVQDMRAARKGARRNLQPREGQKEKQKRGEREGGDLGRLRCWVRGRLTRLIYARGKKKTG